MNEVLLKIFLIIFLIFIGSATSPIAKTDSLYGEVRDKANEKLQLLIESRKDEIIVSITSLKGDKSRTIDLGSYTVDLPPGENWNVKIDKNAGRVLFVKKPTSLFGGEGFNETRIQVSYNWVANENMWHLSEEEIANNYRDGEVNNMMMLGVLQGKYELHDVKKSTKHFDGKKLYTLSYKQMGGEWIGTDIILESILYMYFPPSFKETHTFYLFLICEVCRLDKRIPADLTAILPVIESLRLK
jgi:hypothetical protein